MKIFFINYKILHNFYEIFRLTYSNLQHIKLQDHEQHKNTLG